MQNHSCPRHRSRIGYFLRDLQAKTHHLNMIQSFKIRQTNCGVGVNLIPTRFVRNHHIFSKITVRSRISWNPIASPSKHPFTTQKYKSSIIKAAAASGSSSPQHSNRDAHGHGGGRNIVIAVDTSPAAQAACRWALKELIRPGDLVHLAHCIPSFPSQGLYTLSDGRLAIVNFEKLLHNEKEYLKAAERVVSEWAWEIFQNTGIPYIVDVIKENEVISGDKRGIANLLCKKAEELNAAALILCPHGKGGLGELLMGSVAADCGRYCKDTPVVVLHEPAHSGGGTSTGKEKKNSVVTWLSNLLVQELGHPDTVGTAAEVIAESAANGPLHTGKSNSNNTKKVVEYYSDEDASFSDVDVDDDYNLIGQAAGEVPGTEIDFSTAPHEDQPKNKEGKRQGRTIVITVDDSEASSHAAAWAAHHMYRKGDKLHLLHVIPSLPSVAYGAGPMAGLSSSFLYVLDPPTSAYKEATEKYMEKRFNGMLRAAGVDFESDILLEMTDGGVESVGKALLNRAGEVGASAVVVGSQHGTGGLGELLLGSVGQWLAHHSLEIPVVILH
jgi:nucleotide-binding universal stress UspA family protein